MINENEFRISNESYTRKDFYQLYPEIVELFKSLSPNYQPDESNESDPGVVLLKLAAFLADKIDYNSDKKILETFMTSATQEESMRKLCDMMGYNMKYYQSAETDVSFMWVGDVLPTVPNYKNYILIDRFTELQNEDGNVSYVLTEPVNLTYKGQVVTAPAIEGTLQTVEINSDNLVRLFNLDDNRRFYLPESQIAENGIWIWSDNDDSKNIKFWKKVDNLNTEQPKQEVWKFGYDSRKKIPYILFPEDIAELIGNGLHINYVRTSGINGNIAAQTLTKLSKKDSVDYYENNQPDITNPTLPIKNGNDTYLVIQNTSYTSNGRNIETIDEAYNGFKKTIGTFDTLVTCLDYANKIYQLTYSDINRNPLVSNAQTSDIKDDINFAYKIVSFDEFGMFYSDISEKISKVNVVDELPESFDSSDLGKIYLCNKVYWQVTEYNGSYTPLRVSEESINKINNFDLYIYPLKDANNFYNVNNYTKSFKPNYTNTYEIINQLNDYKTLSHNIKQISNSDSCTDIYNIKNYYHLNAKISTTYKVSQYEGSQILSNIYCALWNKFNARELDYGEEIPYDILLETIEKADTRIKSVSLEEPELTTAVMYGDGTEKVILTNEGEPIEDDTESKDLFYKLLAKNVLAGRLPLFNYDTRFNYKIGEVNTNSGSIYGNVAEYAATNTTTAPVISDGKYNNKYLSVTHISSELDIPINRLATTGYKLKENETVDFLYPNLSTVANGIYPAYVNYFFKYGAASSTEGTPCCLTNLYSTYKDYFLIIIPEFRNEETFSNTDELRTKIASMPQNRYVWWNDSETFKICDIGATYSSSKTYYTTKAIGNENFGVLCAYYNPDGDDTPAPLYAIQNNSILNIPGYLIDANHNLFKKVYSYNGILTTCYARLSSDRKTELNTLALANNQPVIFTSPEEDDTEGDTASSTYVEENTEYQLHEGDELYINYTDSDNIIHNIKYWTDGTSYYKRDDTAGENTGIIEEFSGIIKPNFDLYDSQREAVSGSGRSWSKKTGYCWTNIPGMFSLSGQQQIEMRQFVEAKLNDSPTYCYWILKDGTDLVLNKINNSNPYIYEYILDNDEYFFYTDNLKNSLATLGSGTSVQIYSDTDRGDSIKLTLKDSTVDLNDVASKGIGAFNDTQWVSLKLGETYYLKFIENQIISLGEGDTISGFSNQEDFSKVSTEWVTINYSDTVKYNGKSLPKFNFNTAYDYKWKVRALLTLNINDTTGQLLKCDTQTSNQVQQKVILYTSFWKEAGTNKYVEYDAERFAAGEIAEEYKSSTGKTKLVEFVTNSISNTEFTLKSNYEIYNAGGSYINMHRYTVDNKQKDDLYVYPYMPQNIEIKRNTSETFEPTTNVSTYADSYFRFSLKDVDAIRLPIFKPDNCFGVIMVYYTPSTNTVTKPKATIVSEDTAQEAISFYKDNYDGESAQTEITLDYGINIIRLDSGGYLTLTKTDALDAGSFIVSDIDIVKIESIDEDGQTVEIQSGLNYKLLNIDYHNCNEFIEDYLIANDLNNIFYYNAPINKYSQLDVDYVNQTSFFNYNNICNKFVIAQLDSDFKDIQIAKSSRIAKW